MKKVIVLLVCYSFSEILVPDLFLMTFLESNIFP